MSAARGEAFFFASDVDREACVCVCVYVWVGDSSESHQSPFL